ncbi:MAG: hypothetical protein EZS28_047273, partial [Streblomastix strix]
PLLSVRDGQRERESRLRDFKYGITTEVILSKKSKEMFKKSANNLGHTTLIKAESKVSKFRRIVSSQSVAGLKAEGFQQIALLQSIIELQKDLLGNLATWTSDSYLLCL